MSAGCPHRIAIDVQRRPANALNIEAATPASRCSIKEPDHWPNKDMSMRWRMSGGSPFVFGLCNADCPLKIIDANAA